MTFPEAVKAMIERSGYFIGRPGGIVLVMNSHGTMIRPDRKSASWICLKAMDVIAIDWGLFPIPGQEQSSEGAPA
jgi:hypothetical protein